MYRFYTAINIFSKSCNDESAYVSKAYKIAAVTFRWLCYGDLESRSVGITDATRFCCSSL
jgi:hypothetical protein